MKKVKTYWAEIAIAGDYDLARTISADFCKKGLCVTVTRTTYIYTGGEQAGVLVRLINYPRFPAKKKKILKDAIALADKLRSWLHQDIYSIVTPDKTLWVTRGNRGSNETRK